MSFRKGEDAFDAWSWVHLASGIGLGFLNLEPVTAATVLVGFEVIEGGLRQIKTEEGGLFEYESWSNIIADIAVGLLGYGIFRAVRNRRRRRRRPLRIR